jgi:hypothetical protein
MDGEVMPVTKEQADLLAILAAACRPHGARRWEAPGIVAAIGKVKHLALADVAFATLRAAVDRNLETPGAIGNTKAPCWAERIAEPPTRRHPSPAEACRRCGRDLAPGCCDQPTRRNEGGAAPAWFRQLATSPTQPEEP